MGSKLAFAAVVLALAAIALHFVGARSEPRAARDALAADGAVATLEARVAALEAEAAELRRAVAASAIVPVAAPAERVAADAEDREPDPRVAALEARVARLEQGPTTPDPGAAERAVRLELARALGGRGMTTDEAVARARDLAASEEERLQGLRALRGQRLGDGGDARLLVLDDMLELARTSQDGGVRADVWRQLSGVTDRRLLEPLLDALAFDRSAKAREEAAETLADFLPDRAADAALRHAAEHDADRSVREQALESLDGRRR